MPADLAAPTAPAMLHIDVVCICCSATAQIWIAQEEIDSMRFCWSPLDRAYLHTCGRCLYQRVDADAPLPKQPRRADHERTTHHRRQTGQRAALSVGRAR